MENNNGVDVSPERVAAEWDKIAENWGLVAIAEAVEQSGTVPESEPEIVLSAEEFDQKKEVTKSLINSGLGMAFFALGVSEIPDNITNDFAESWAVVIVNRFPDNPVTDFMDAYGDLIAAGGASLVLIGAVKKSRADVKATVKRELEQAAKKGAERVE